MKQRDKHQVSTDCIPYRSLINIEKLINVENTQLFTANDWKILRGLLKEQSTSVTTPEAVFFLNLTDSEREMF